MVAGPHSAAASARRRRSAKPRLGPASSASMQLRRRATRASASPRALHPKSLVRSLRALLVGVDVCRMHQAQQAANCKTAAIALRRRMCDTNRHTLQATTVRKKALKQHCSPLHLLLHPCPLLVHCRALGLHSQRHMWARSGTVQYDRGTSGRRTVCSRFSSRRATATVKRHPAATAPSAAGDRTHRPSLRLAETEVRPCCRLLIRCREASSSLLSLSNSFSSAIAGCQE